MKPRYRFPPDIAALLLSPIIILAIALLVGLLFPVINWLRHLMGFA